jgi:hypothetical protein
VIVVGRSGRYDQWVVIQFEVEEAYYDKKYILQHPEIISLAKIKNERRTKKISDDGKLSGRYRCL